ncbi:MAG: CinA family protein [Endozoicomonas sp.]
MDSVPVKHSELLVQEIASVLQVRGWSLATAESCTGGGIGRELTVVPGSSLWYEGGVICYSNDVKTRLLSVPGPVLEECGAVSEPVALAMAEGVRKLLLTDVSIGVTGIAGPGGGTLDKPVGTVWISWSLADKFMARCFHFQGERSQIRSQAVMEALKGLLNLLQ